VVVWVLAAMVLGAAPAGAGLPDGGPHPSAHSVDPDASAAQAAVHTVAAAAIQIVGITPRMVNTNKAKLVNIDVRVHNNTGSALSGLSIEIQRGHPIQTQAAMTAALLKAPATDDVTAGSEQITKPIPAGATVDAVVRATTDLTALDGTPGLCLNGCSYGVYPIDVVLNQLDTTDGVELELSRDHTFVPSFVAGAAGLAAAPKQNVQLSWVWPLLDGPHRGASKTEFTDDNLRAEIIEGGRLENSLAVLQQVQKLAPTVRMTLVVDPELIDELTVMASPDGYTIAGPRNTQVKGTGGPEAQVFLTALKAVAMSDDVSMTGYADPDVSALADNDVKLPVLPTETKKAVEAVFGGAYPAQDLTWPAGAEISDKGLDLAAASGSTAVLLNEDALPQQPASRVTPNALSPLDTDTTPVNAVVLDSVLQKSYANVIASGSSSRWVQTLQAELAVRAAQEPTKTHYIALAPPRDVNIPNPTALAQTIALLSTESWSTSLTVRQALTSVTTYIRGALMPDTSGAGITPDQLSTLSAVSSQVGLFSTCLAGGADNALLAYYPNAIARAESSWWRGHPSEGQAYADSLKRSIDGLISKVRIVLRRDPSYTLASDGAPIPVTVENDLRVPVTISVRIREVAGIRGFRANTVAAHTIGPGTRVGISVITHVARSGRFPVNFFLTTPDGQHDLSGAQPVRIHSNALGTVALWITGIAFAILVLAVIVRAIRRLIRRRRPQPPAEDASALITS
jgi:hypothetical protein